MRRKNKPADRKRKPRAPALRAVLPNAPELPRHEWRPASGDKRRKLLSAPLKRWQLQEAKAKFSALFNRALEEGPQVVTRHNKQAVVVLSADEYRELAGGPQKPALGMLQALLQCPKGPDLHIERDKSTTILDLPPVFD